VVQVNSDTAIQIKINRGYFFVLNQILLKRNFEDSINDFGLLSKIHPARNKFSKTPCVNLELMRQRKSLLVCKQWIWWKKV